MHAGDAVDRPLPVIRPRTVTLLLLAVAVALVAAHVVSQVARFEFGRGTLLGITERVYFGGEHTLPAWFSSSLLLACGALLLWIGAVTRSGAAHWTLLGLVFVGLSADESAAIHEMTAPLFVSTVQWLAAHTGGLFDALVLKPQYAWVIGGAAFATALGVAYLPFLFRLPARTRVLFALSGALYVGGALGLEVVGGRYSGLYGPDNPTFVTILTFEETFEMLGLIAFLHGLLDYAGTAFGAVGVAVRGTPAAAGAPAARPDAALPAAPRPASGFGVRRRVP